MRVAVVMTALACAASLAWTAEPAKKAASQKTTPSKPGTASKAAPKGNAGSKSRKTGASQTAASKPGVSKTGASKTGSASTAAKSRTGAKTGAGKKAVARRPVRVLQQQPTQDRYKQIEAALAQRGYLQGEPTGQWSPASQEALKRFQQEQNLNPTGKIDSLSLIALGLGPRRTASAQGSSSTPKAQP